MLCIHITHTNNILSLLNGLKLTLMYMLKLKEKNGHNVMNQKVWNKCINRNQYSIIIPYFPWHYCIFPFHIYLVFLHFMQFFFFFFDISRSVRTLGSTLHSSAGWSVNAWPKIKKHYTATASARAEIRLSCLSSLPMQPSLHGSNTTRNRNNSA